MDWRWLIPIAALFGALYGYLIGYGRGMKVATERMLEMRAEVRRTEDEGGG